MTTGLGVTSANSSSWWIVSSYFGGGTLSSDSMLDYFKLPGDTPGHGSRPSPGGRAVVHVEAAIGAEWDDRRLIPYVSLHELEALLYVRPQAVADVAGQPGLAVRLSSIVAECGAPEAIDDGPQTAPSKRLLQEWPSYSKTTDFVAVTKAIGLTEIRDVCPHFDQWLRKLEDRAAAAPGIDVA